MKKLALLLIAAGAVGYFGEWYIEFIPLYYWQMICGSTIIVGVILYAVMKMQESGEEMVKAKIKYYDLKEKADSLEKNVWAKANLINSYADRTQILRNKIIEFERHIATMASKFDSKKHSKVVELTAEIEKLKRKISSQNANYVRLLNKYNRLKDLEVL